MTDHNLSNLLRSVIICDPQKDRNDYFLENFFNLRDSRLEFPIIEHQKIWDFVSKFILGHGHIPEANTVQSCFNRDDQTSTVDQLSFLKMRSPLTQGDFKVELEWHAEEKRKRNANELLENARIINSSGLQIGEGKKTQILSGPQDSLRYVINHAHDIIKPTLGSRLYAVVNEDMPDFEEEYERRKRNPSTAVGAMTGIRQIDMGTKGAKKYELWTHAAFTGHMKTTFALNWIYYQAIWQGKDSYYYSLEMPYEQIRRIIVAMHSFHDKFENVRIRLGLQDRKGEMTSLEYQNIRDADLHKDAEKGPEKEKFLKQYVIPDLGNPENEYGRIHVESADPDKSDITIADIKAQAEILHTQSPFEMIIIDHLLLVSPRGRHSSTTERLNEVVRDAKRMALSFNRGEGMAVVALYQLSREGFKHAEKNEGMYNLTHLSYSNEIERCVKEGTEVYTKGGFLPIEQVNVGDFVYSSTGWKEVLNKFDNGQKEIWKLECVRGEILEATGNHRVRIYHAGDIYWISVKYIKRGDILLGMERSKVESMAANDEFFSTEEKREMLVVKSCFASSQIAQVYDLEVEGDHEYLTGEFLSHNSSDLVTTTWIDDEMRKQALVQFQCLKSRDQAIFDPFRAAVHWPCRMLMTCEEEISSASGLQNPEDESFDLEEMLDDVVVESPVKDIKKAV